MWLKISILCKFLGRHLKKRQVVLSKNNIVFYFPLVFCLGGNCPCPSVQVDEIWITVQTSSQPPFHRGLLQTPKNPFFFFFLVLPSFNALFTESIKIARSETKNFSNCLENKKTVKKNKSGCLIGSLKRGQRSYFLIGHLQELGIHISGTLSFLVEQKLVVAAISTNSYKLRRRRNKLKMSVCTNTTQRIHHMVLRQIKKL